MRPTPIQPAACLGRRSYACSSSCNRLQQCSRRVSRGVKRAACGGRVDRAIEPAGAHLVAHRAGRRRERTRRCEAGKFVEDAPGRPASSTFFPVRGNKVERAQRAMPRSALVPHRDGTTFRGPTRSWPRGTKSPPDGKRVPRAEPTLSERNELPAAVIATSRTGAYPRCNRLQPTDCDGVACRTPLRAAEERAGRWDCTATA